MSVRAMSRKALHLRAYGACDGMPPQPSTSEALACLEVSGRRGAEAFPGGPNESPGRGGGVPGCERVCSANTGGFQAGRPPMRTCMEPRKRAWVVRVGVPGRGGLAVSRRANGAPWGTREGLVCLDVRACRARDSISRRAKGAPWGSTERVSRSQTHAWRGSAGSAGSAGSSPGAGAAAAAAGAAAASEVEVEVEVEVVAEAWPWRYRA